MIDREASLPRMLRLRTGILAVCGSALLLSALGCRTRVADFTIISSKNIDLSRAAEFVRGDSRIEADDRIHIIVIVPTGVPNMKAALDRAIEATPGAIGLLDGVVYEVGWYIPLIYGTAGYEVQGTPLIDPARTGQ